MVVAIGNCVVCTLHDGWGVESRGEWSTRSDQLQVLPTKETANLRASLPRQPTSPAPLTAKHSGLQDQTDQQLALDRSASHAVAENIQNSYSQLNTSTLSHLVSSRTIQKTPSLEFTLGRQDWQAGDQHPDAPKELLLLKC
eukprot:Gb_17468 [translate_table: standard]